MLVIYCMSKKFEKALISIAILYNINTNIIEDVSYLKHYNISIFKAEKIALDLGIILRKKYSEDILIYTRFRGNIDDALFIKKEDIKVYLIPCICITTNNITNYIHIEEKKEDGKSKCILI